jgi:MoaA/NifB/PqqE/SkfB family radical SAM enzyme
MEQLISNNLQFGANNSFLSEAPAFINWHYTYTCNFNCTHCYSRTRGYPNELSSEIYDKFIRDMISSGVTLVSFGGGEPTIRKDLNSTIRKLSDAGIYTLLTSNGWDLDDEYIDCLCSAGLNSLILSIDGITAEEHDDVRGKKGSFNKVIETLTKVSKSKLEISTSITLTAQNFDKLNQFVNLVASTGAHSINFKLFRPAGNGYTNRHLFELTDSKVDTIRKEIRRLQKEDRIKLHLYQNEESKSCSCGNEMLTLRPNGDLSLCPYSNIIVGNLIDKPLKEIWLNSPVLKQKRESSCGCIGELNSPSPLKEVTQEQLDFINK